MIILWFLLISSSVLWVCAQKESPVERSSENLHKLLPVDLKNEGPTVMVTLMVRNKAHVLPVFLSYFERQDYPKKRMSLWIYSDYNTDNSIEILNEWLSNAEPLYHSVKKVLDATTERHQNESSPFDWPSARFEHLIALKEQALHDAKQVSADYIFYLDADVLLTAAHTLTHLVELRLPIVAPLLLSEGLYTNFYYSTTSDYYYLLTDLHEDIYNANREGIFQVSVIHSAVLVSLSFKGSDYLTFDRNKLLAQQKNDSEFMATLDPQCRLYDGPVNDVFVFAFSANCSRIPLLITNEIPFGYILQPLYPSDYVEQDYNQLINIQANIINDLGALVEVNKHLKKFERKQKKHKVFLDHIYMINLERRPERRVKMENLFEVLGLDVEHFPAVDGKKLNNSLLREMGVKLLLGADDPCQQRQLTMGEIGCFLSHYKIWERIVEKQQEHVLVLEDDVTFEPYFKKNAEAVMEQTRNIKEYDLLYFGRSPMREDSETLVANTENLVHVSYSYGSFGYVLSLTGAQKLLDAKPLENLLPVDEFLPIMFNSNPNKIWTNAFPKRDLLAFSASPLLLYPSHYSGDFGHTSDTEDSVVIKDYQLKSDCKEFSREQRLDSPLIETKDPQFQESPVGKTLEDLHKLLPINLKNEEPIVLVTLLVRNKAHILPLFLSYFERQDYPKNRISLWIYSDYNTDNSIEIFNEWLLNAEPLYHSVKKVLDATTARHQNESSPFDWPSARFEHLIALKEQALHDAKQISADYIFYLDAEVLLTAAHTLTHLVELRLPIVAPLLLSEGLYTNFYYSTTSDYYYLLTDLHEDIYNANREGIFQVSVIHSAVLVSLSFKGSNYLTFDRNKLLAQQKNDSEFMTALRPQCTLYDGPIDDITVFAFSANCSRIPLLITNEIAFGYILQPLYPSDTVDQDYKQLINIQANIINDIGALVKVNKHLKRFERKQKKHKVFLDHIYMINLESRPERRVKMENLFEVLGLDVEHFPAVDGKKLNNSFLKEMGVKLILGVDDCSQHRQFTMGEIGCFLSHYKIWETIVEKQQKQVLVLEDDVMFENYFKEKAEAVMEQTRNIKEYDLLYFGRKPMTEDSETLVANTENLVHVSYSYGSFGYVLSLTGAQKLLDAKPLENVLPVDVFLPIMFNSNPYKICTRAFPKQDLLAFSASPLLLYPSHYTGDLPHTSDTEDSVVIKDYQLRSDCEEYFREQRLDSPLIETKDPQFQVAVNAKIHKEL